MRNNIKRRPGHCPQGTSGKENARRAVAARTMQTMKAPETEGNCRDIVSVPRKI
jgi:hypothetical protein